MFADMQSMLALILVALGLLGVILSFLVAERRKSWLSLGLACLIMVTGLVQFFSTKIRQWRFERRLAELRTQQRTTLEGLARQKGPAGTPGKEGTAPPGER